MIVFVIVRRKKIHASGVGKSFSLPCMSTKKLLQDHSQFDVIVQTVWRLARKFYNLVISLKEGTSRNYWPAG